MTQWEYRTLRRDTLLGDVRHLDELGRHGWELVTMDVHHFYLKRQKSTTPPPPPKTTPTSLTLKIQGAKHMANFTVDTTDGTATLQFTDDKGDAVAGPVDSVTAAPVVPVVASDNTAALTADVAAPGATAGSFVSHLTPVAAGVANVSVAALVNSDGTPVNEADGVTPFGVPAPVEVTVAAGPASTLTLAVTG